MKKNEIINTLQKDKQFLKENYGVVNIALFGSYAKGLEKKEEGNNKFKAGDLKAAESSWKEGVSYLEKISDASKESKGTNCDPISKHRCCLQ